MKIRNLKDTPFEEILICFFEAFSDYFVKLPTSPTYWEKRFEAARVNYEFSYGVFDDEKLVAYIIHGTDMHNDILTAFNTGTGVLPDYRGKKLVDQMYAFGLPQMKAIGIGKCMLEVIQENARAIKVYERIGFSKTRNLKCFTGKVKPTKPQSGVQPLSMELVSNMDNPNEHFYSWDNSIDAIQNSGDSYQAYSPVNGKGLPIGFFIIDPTTGYLAQLESSTENFDYLINGIAQVSEQVKLNNVDERRQELIQNLTNAGFTNTIDQYEMEMML